MSCAYGQSQCSIGKMDIGFAASIKPGRVVNVGHTTIRDASACFVREGARREQAGCFDGGSPKVDEGKRWPSSSDMER